MSIRIPPFRGLAGPRFSARRSSWAPNNVTSATLRAAYDFNDASTLFTNSAGTTPVAALNDIVRRYGPCSLTPSAPYFTAPDDSSSGLWKAVSGGVGRGLQLDGSNDQYLCSSPTHFNFMHQSAGFTLVDVLAWTDVDSGGYHCLFASTYQDGTEHGVFLGVSDSGAAAGAPYFWISNGSTNIIQAFGSPNAAAHGTSMMPLVMAWQNGFAGDDFIYRLNGTQVTSVNTSGSPSASNSTRTPQVGRRPVDGFAPAKATLRYQLRYEGRVSAAEILLLESWSATL